MMEILNKVKANIKTVSIIIFLSFGLILGVYLVQNRQIFKSRATSEINSALSVSDEAGNELEYGNGSYKTNSLNIRIGIKDLEQLNQW